jgi:hypothetical protein
MAEIKFELTDSELKCMEFCAFSPQEWADNAMSNRARVAGDKIVNAMVMYCNDNEVALPVGREAQIEQAFELGVVDTAANRQAAIEESLSEMSP